MKTIELPIIRYKAHQLMAVNDTLAIEEPLEISLLYEKEGISYNKNISITMRTPDNDAELVAGFLFTEGILSSFAQIENMQQLAENQFLVTLKKDIP